MTLRARHAGVAAVALGCAALLGACTAGEPSPESLRSSFAAHIADIDFVEDFKRDGDFISFIREDGGGARVGWQVHIDTTEIVPHEDDVATPYRGIVKSTWHLDDHPVISRGDESGLPQWVLETGLSQDCWAFWNIDLQAWTWL